MNTTRMLITGLAAAAALGLTACTGPVRLGSGAAPGTPSAPSASPSSASTEASPAAGVSASPVAEPTSYRDKLWAYEADPSVRDSGAYAKVPSGWAETVRATYWSDFVDPTGRLRLRVDVTPGMSNPAHPTSPKQDADAELKRVSAAAGFKLLGRRTIAAQDGTQFGAAELVYRATVDHDLVQVTYRFVCDETTMAKVAVYYPADQLDVAESVLTTVEHSVAFGG